MLLEIMKSINKFANLQNAGIVVHNANFLVSLEIKVSKG